MRSGQRLRYTAETMPIAMPNSDRPRHAPHREPERRHEAVGDLGRTPAAWCAATVPKSQCSDADDEAHELLRQRPVEPEVLADELDRFRASRRARRRAARDRPAAGARTGRRAGRRSAASAAGRAGASRCTGASPTSTCERTRVVRAGSAALRRRRRITCRSASQKLNDASGITYTPDELLAVRRQQPLDHERRPRRVVPDRLLRVLVELRLLGARRSRAARP